MKTVTLSETALAVLRQHRSDQARILAKIRRYAETGAGDVTQLVGSPNKRLRVGDYRVIFSETETDILVLKLGPRGSIYD